MARQEIDVAECLRRGAIGALGAIPGTLAAHPIDLVKIRIQTGAGSIRAAMRGLGTRASDWPRYYRGLGPGVPAVHTLLGLGKFPEAGDLGFGKIVEVYLPAAQAPLARACG